MNYEENIKQIEDIISKLENGKLTLKDSLECFEQATKCLEECSYELKQANGKVYILKQKLDEIVEEEFDN